MPVCPLGVLIPPLLPALSADNGTIASITVPAEGCLAPPDEEAVEAITNPGGAVTDNFGIPMASSVLSRPDGQQAFMRAADQDQAIWCASKGPFLFGAGWVGCGYVCWGGRVCGCVL